MEGTLTALSPEAQKLIEGKSKSAQASICKLAKAELERRKKANPLKYYIPNGAIEKLINAVGDSHKWIYILPAANSVGKTSAAINILGNIIWGAQSEWYKGERFRIWTYPKIFWYVSQHSTLKDFVCGVDENTPSEIRKWFPQGKYEFEKSGKEYYSQLSTDNGWQGSFKTYDQDIKEFEAAKIGVAILDEPPPQNIFNAILARMTMGGIIIMPMTPLTHSAWTLDRLVSGATDESDVFVLYADIEDNCKQHGIRGIMDHEQIERIIAQYDPDEIDARVHGRYTHLSGVVFPELHPATHRHNIPTSEFTQDKYQIFNVVDPHDTRPPFAGWFAVDKWENSFAIDEYPEEPFHLIKRCTLTTKQICEKIKEKEQANGWDGAKIIRVMDPNFGEQNQQTVGLTTRDYYAKCGREMNYQLNYRLDVNNSIADGHKWVRENLVLNPDGNAKFKIGENCWNIWYQLTHYSRSIRTGKALETHGEGEKVAERFKDGADVVRYFFAFLRKPTEKVVETKKEKTAAYIASREYAEKEIFERKLRNWRKKSRDAI